MGRFIDGYSKSLTLHIVAVLIRGLIGLALLSCSPLAKFPVRFQVLGWATKVSTLYKRMGGFLAVLFGSFLFYGVV